MLRRVANVIASGLLVLAVCPFISAETHKNCENAQVEYKPFDPELANKIVLQPTGKSFVEPDKKERITSPQGTTWFVQVTPDFTKPGPWTTELTIGGNALNGKPFKVKFIDHGSGGVDARWLNEKLMFIEVWWGRFGSTDMILDVSRRTFIYREDANYGKLIQSSE